MSILTLGCPRHANLRQTENTRMQNPPQFLVFSEAAHLIASRGQRGRFLYPIFFFLLNLLVCAAFERRLRLDTTGTAFGYFFILEFGVYCAFLLAQYQRLILPVLEKSTVFPTSFLTTLAFCMWSDMRRPVAVAFLVTNMLLLGVVCQSSIGVMLLTAVMYSLLFISVEVSFVSFALVVRRSQNPEVILLICFVSLLLATFVIAELFGGGPVVTLLPITSWAAHGIVAARSANLGGVLLSILVLAGTTTLIAVAANTLQERRWKI
jgi:hypothetical protein